MGYAEKVGQQLALTGDLGRVCPSEGPRISGFAQRIGIKGGNTTKPKQGKQQGKEAERERLTKKRTKRLTYYSTIQGLPIFNW